MSELWMHRFNHTSFGKGLKAKHSSSHQASLSPYQHGKAAKDLVAHDDFAHPGQYKKTKFSRTNTSKRWGW